MNIEVADVNGGFNNIAQSYLISIRQDGGVGNGKGSTGIFSSDCNRAFATLCTGDNELITFPMAGSIFFIDSKSHGHIILT